MTLTQINVVSSKKPQTLSAGVLAVLRTTIKLETSPLDETKLCGKEDFISLPSPLEPFTQQFLTVAIETTRKPLAPNSSENSRLILTRHYQSF